MNGRFGKSSSTKNLMLFWAGWLRNPRRIGAVAPSSGALARAMFREIPHDPDSNKLPIIELGGGTGSITAALLENGIAPHRLIVVERDEHLAKHLKLRFSGVSVVCGDAGGLPALMNAQKIERVAAIVSGLPLLLFPPSLLDALVNGSFTMLGPERPLIQFTYGSRSPLPDRYGLLIRRVKKIWGMYRPRRFGPIGSRATVIIEIYTRLQPNSLSYQIVSCMI